MLARRRHLQPAVSTAIVCACLTALAQKSIMIFGVSIRTYLLHYPGEWACEGGSESLLVLQPKRAGRYPLVTFAHGRGVSPDFYFVALAAIARSGFVVLAPTAGQTGQLMCDVWCLEEHEDTLTAINIARSNRLPAADYAEVSPFDSIDWSKPVGLTGHSMGGIAALTAASSDWGIPIGAVVANSPAYGWALPDRGITRQRIKSPAVLVTYGTNDVTSLWPRVVNETSTDDVVAILEGMDHDGGTQSPELAEELIVPFLACHLTSDARACAMVQSKKSRARESLREGKVYAEAECCFDPDQYQRAPLDAWCATCRVPPKSTQESEHCLQRLVSQCEDWTRFMKVLDPSCPGDFSPANGWMVSGGRSPNPRCAAAAEKSGPVAFV